MQRSFSQSTPVKNKAFGMEWIGGGNVDERPWEEEMQNYGSA